MRFEDYTPDAICAALGLYSFRDPGVLGAAGGPAVRVLLMPSFDPEVCVTLAIGPAGETADVRTLHEMFWHQPTPADRPVVFAERVRLPGGTVGEIADAFAAAARLLGEPGRKRWVVIADGMPVAALGRAGGVEQAVDANVGVTGEWASFVARLIDVLYPLLPVGHCRNALARAGRYVDLHLAVDSLPAVQNVTRLLVLGDEEGRKEVADHLRRARRPSGGDANGERGE